MTDPKTDLLNNRPENMMQFFNLNIYTKCDVKIFPEKVILA